MEAKVIYLADQDTDNVDELYLVDISSGTPGTPQKVNGFLASTRDVTVAGIQFSPDSSKILYRADQDTDSVFELYQVDTSSPGTPQKVNGILVPGGSVYSASFYESFIYSPDNSRILYLADEETDNLRELFLVFSSSPGTSYKVSGTLPVGRFISNSGYFFSPDSNKVLYSSDQETASKVELYIVDVSGASPGADQKINGAFLTAGSDIWFFKFSPDSGTVYYHADQVVDGQYNIYAVDVSGTNPGADLIVNPTVLGSGVWGESHITPDGSNLLYRATQDDIGTDELYLVDTSNLGVSTKASGTLVTDGDVAFNNYLISPDGSLILYLADQDTNNMFELYLVNMTNPGISQKVNGTISAGSGILSGQYQFSPDSSRMLYVADPDDDGFDELFLVSVSGASPGAAQTVTSALVLNGEVTALGIQFSP